MSFAPGELAVDARWDGPHGIGRHAREVLARLPEATRITGPRLFTPLEPLALSLRVRASGAKLFYSPGFAPPRFPGCALVFTIHDLIHLECDGESSALRRLYYARVVRPCARAAYRVLTVSESSKRAIAAWADLAPDRVEVVGGGVDERFTPDGPKHAPGFRYVLFMGNRKPHGNFARLVEALARVRERDLKLLCRGAADEATRAVLRASSMEERVVFAGTIPEEELASYYRGALALAIPSTHEGFGLPALEALACGTPVLAAEAGALPEVVGETAVRVDPLAIDSIRDGLARLARDAELRQSLSEQGPARAARFRWEDVAARVRRVLEGALAEVRAG